MNLNDILLPSFLVEDLYRNHLVENSNPGTHKTIATQHTIEKKGIQYLGKNQQNICLLVNYANDVYLPDHELNFLSSILQACKLNLGDVAIVNYHQQKTSFTLLQQELACKYLLVFGISAASIGLIEKPFFMAYKENDCQVVYAPAAEELNNSQPASKSLKSKLWSCLKQLFAI